jgi:DNA polymerase-4
MTRTILHIDLDAFFASVEVKRDPTLAGKPVIVGGNGARGVVAACTYEARSYGIRSAMSSVEAQRRCPHAVFIPGHFNDYARESSAVFSIVRDITPTVEMLSLDEAFCDLGPALRRLGSPAHIGRALRERIKDECGLAASVGVAPTKMIAKLA